MFSLCRFFCVVIYTITQTVANGSDINDELQNTGPRIAQYTAEETYQQLQSRRDDIVAPSCLSINSFVIKTSVLFSGLFMSLLLENEEFIAASILYVLVHDQVELLSTIEWKKHFHDTIKEPRAFIKNPKSYLYENRENIYDFALYSCLTYISVSYFTWIINEYNRLQNVDLMLNLINRKM
jgi:hypothetical protein